MREPHIMRALEVAKIYAMQDICQQAGINVTAVREVIFGRLKTGEVKTNSGHKLKRLEFLEPVVSDDEISIKVIAEVE
jgi:hypothetical protein